MERFEYVRAADEAKAMDAMRMQNARFLAGGTTLVDLMKLGVERPPRLVDVNALALAKIEEAEGGLRVGAMARNADLAHHAAVRAGWPALSEALLAGASPQIRNVATTAGNLLQRTRCVYFRDVSNGACNKRAPGSGCAAMDGWTRMHALLGTSDKCIAANPSDMCVALVALDAVVHVRGASGERAIPIADFHTLPGGRPDVETVLAHGDLVTHVTLPGGPLAQRSRYVKVRDRASYAFALASCAASFVVENGKIAQARVALGGVAAKPWRSVEAEKELVGKKPERAAYKAAADAALNDAKPRGENAFKVELAKRTIVRALDLVGGAK